MKKLFENWKRYLNESLNYSELFKSGDLDTVNMAIDLAIGAEEIPAPDQLKRLNTPRLPTQPALDRIVAVFNAKEGETSEEYDSMPGGVPLEFVNWLEQNGAKNKRKENVPGGNLTFELGMRKATIYFAQDPAAGQKDWVGVLNKF
jgi:hypothetical protein